MKSHNLFPGKLAVFKEETVISTLLGSCVAVAIFDPMTKIGGLNHYLLPEGAEGERQNTRYGANAIPLLVEELVKIGADRSKLVAKIYGGANVITSTRNKLNGIGKRNIDAAEQILKSLFIPIKERDVGGHFARTIKMNTATFHVALTVSGEQIEENPEPIDISGFKPLRVAKAVKVLIIDDSATVRTLFKNIFSKSGLEVVGVASDAYEARELIVKTKPDVLTLDIEMPKMSGVTFLEKIMKHHPIPVVMVSSLASTGEAALRSLELGAIEFVHKPSQFDPTVLRDLAAILVGKVSAAASVTQLKKIHDAPAVIDTRSSGATPTSYRKSSELKIIVIGGNAGSTEAIEKFVKNIASDTPPVVIACSTVANFADSFAGKLRKNAKVQIVVPQDCEVLRMGTVYILPAGFHGKVHRGPAGPSVTLIKEAPVSLQLPSSDVLFKSAASAFAGGVYAILLGGFGFDGVEGVEEVQAKGGVTVVQHPEEAQFPYGPQKAIELGIADEIIFADKLAAHLMSYRNQNVY